MAESQDKEVWGTRIFRDNMKIKIQQAIEQSGKPTAESAENMEKEAFQKAKTSDDYIKEVGCVLMRVKGINAKCDMLIFKLNE
ncbi:hypothetical protein TNCV_3206871 [Trichonephila clavipes]|nr:hypothetical protein TNCV_3206871 [Trichonephila clavipes]